MGTIIEDVAQAVLMMQDASASYEERQGAMAFVDEFKDSSNDLFNVGLYMAVLQEDSVLSVHDQRIRYSGLQFLLHFVSHRWESISSEEKEGVKAAIFENILQGGVMELGEEQTYIFEKISSLISEIAIREWPQRWPNFIDLLTGLHEHGITHAYVALTALRIFIETILTFNESLQSNRRAELLQGFTVTFPDILSYVQTMIEGSIFAEPSSELETKQYELVAMMSLNVLATFLSWAPLEDLYKENIVQALCTLLSMPQYRQQAADSLLLIVERKGSKGERAPLLDIMDYLEPIVASIEELGQSSLEDEEVYLFVKRLSQVVAELASAQLCTLCCSSGVVRKIPNNLQNFLSILFEFSMHPSLVVSSIAISGWVNLLKTDTVRDWDLVKSAQSTLFQRLSLRVVRDLHTKDDFVGDGAVLCELDFSSYDEWLVFFHEYRHQLMTLLRFISGNFPTTVVNELAGNLSNLLENTPQVRFSTPTCEEDGYLETNTELVQTWDAASALWENCLPRAFSELQLQRKRNFDSGGMALIMDGAEKLIGVMEDENDPSILLHELGVMGSLTICLEENELLLMPMLEKIMFALEFRAVEDYDLLQSQGEGGKTGLSKCATVRKKACEILIQLCDKPPLCFMQALENVCAYVSDVLEKDTTSEMLKRMIVKALVSSFNLLDSLEEQQQRLEDLLSSSLQDWQDFENVVSSAQGIVEFGGLMEVEADVQSNRIKMIVTVLALNVALSDTKPRNVKVGTAYESGIDGSPAGGLVADFASKNLCEVALPNIFSTISSLHKLSDPSRGALSGINQAVLLLRKSDFITHLQSYSGDYSRDLGSDLLWIDRTQLWLETIRHCMYSCCANAAKMGILYQNEEYLQALISMCGDGLEHLTPPQFKSIFKHLICPFETYLPREEPALSASLVTLGHFYEQTATYLETLFQSEQVVSNDLLLEYGDLHGFTSEQIEIVNDTIRTQFGNDVIGHLRRIFTDLSRSRGNKTQPQTNLEEGPMFGPIAQTLLMNEVTAVPILKFVGVGLCGNSSSLAKKTAGLVKSMIQVTADEPIYHNVMLSQFVPFIFTAMSKHGHHPDCLNEFISVLVFAIESMQGGELNDVFGEYDVNAEELVDYYNKVVSGHLQSMKSKRSQVKSLFSRCVGAHVSQWGAENKKVVDVPEKLYVARRRKGDEDADNTVVDLSFFEN
eukprot:m.81577 g.81577  ORF g.81577 m.81577 type:complete len:1188 (+) comp8646_c0_seq2:38-3601(+)